MWNINQGGQSISPKIKLRQSADAGADPFDLTAVTEITTCFIKQDGTELMVSKTGGAIVIVGNPLLGTIVITLTQLQVDSLEFTELPKTLQLNITVAGDPTPLKIPGAYMVNLSEC